jgi:hypothetical protein
MGIKYLKGIYTETKPKTTRPVGVSYPIGLIVTNQGSFANGANTTTTQTFDVLVVAGGGSGGPRRGDAAPSSGGGGGGAGGLRIFSGNNFTNLAEFNNPASFNNLGENVIPITVAGAGGNSSVGNNSNFTNCRGGAGGIGNWNLPGDSGSGGSGTPGGSGGAAGTGAGAGPGGTGIVGQGCNGGPGGGGSALANSSSSGGLTTSITGTNVRYADGGPPGSGVNGTANRGNGAGGGSVVVSGDGPSPIGGSGIVAIRYRNPAAPTTPLAEGGNCVCCTGGCIIHIFNSSGFFNVSTTTNIN